MAVPSSRTMGARPDAQPQSSVTNRAEPGQRCRAARVASSKHELEPRVGDSCDRPAAGLPALHDQTLPGWPRPRRGTCWRRLRAGGPTPRRRVGLDPRPQRIPGLVADRRHVEPEVVAEHVGELRPGRERPLGRTVADPLERQALQYVDTRMPPRGEDPHVPDSVTSTARRGRRRRPSRWRPTATTPAKLPCRVVREVPVTDGARRLVQHQHERALPMLAGDQRHARGGRRRGRRRRTRFRPGSPPSAGRGPSGRGGSPCCPRSERSGPWTPHHVSDHVVAEGLSSPLNAPLRW